MARAGPSYSQPLLADSAIKPTATEIRWTRDAFVDLRRIRACSTLFRLRSANDIVQRLTFCNTGSAQVPTVLAGHVNGDGYEGAGFMELVYLINVDKAAHTVTIEALGGRTFELHPVHRAPGAPGAVDTRAALATWNPVTGRFSVPPRTAVVWVVP